MSIKKRLITTLTVIFFIMIGLSVFSIFKLSDINKKSTTIAEKIVPELNGAHELNFYIARFRSNEYQHSILKTDKEMAALEAKMNNYKNLISLELDNVDPKENSDVNKVQTAWDSYLANDKKLLKLSHDMDTEGCKNLLMGEMKTQYDALATFAEKNVESENQKAIITSEEGHKLYTQSLVILIIVCIIALAIGLILGVLLLIAILKPLKKFQNELTILASSGGDLTREIKVRSKDEMGNMAKALNLFLQNLREIICEVNKNANAVMESSEFVSTQIEALNGYLSNSSATIEELSAGMEETAASAEEVNSSSIEITDSVSSLADKASRGANMVVDISKRATELKHSASNSQRVAVGTYDNSKIQLEIAIQKAEAIEEITLLSNSIMEISNQTNLLALNASIEAARAGKSGTGFAVVASEIGKLADSSKNTVTEIQKITGTVVDAVKELSSGTKNLIEFMDSTVINDYNSFVGVGDAYGKDASYVDELVTDISATSEELTATVEGIMNAIDNVTVSMNQGASGTQDVAKQITEIAQIASEVDLQSRKSAENAKLLKDAVGKFVV